MPLCSDALLAPEKFTIQAYGQAKEKAYTRPKGSEEEKAKGIHDHFY